MDTIRLSQNLHKKTHEEFNGEQGIAIGPILFIIAILAVLAAAIAAGSTAFSGGTTQESTKTKATAIIQMGQNLKFGWDRLTANGITPTNIIIDPAATTATTHMFSPSGGGITPPSNTFADNGYVWAYHVQIAEMGLGSAAVLAVNAEICQEINRQLFGLAIAPDVILGVNLPTSFDDPAQLFDIATTAWPANVPKGTLAFCGTGDGNLYPQPFFIQYFVL